MRNYLNHLLIFSAGFLSFFIQLLETKRLLPFLGGSPSIWIGSLMFFQVALLVSYLLTHKISSLKSPKVFLLSALGLIGGAGALSMVPLTNVSPLITLFQFLLPSGLMFVVLLQISPLIQFFSKESNPYKYYASSNLGAFLGLLSFPLFFEGKINLSSIHFGWWLMAIVAFALGAIVLSLNSSKEGLISPVLRWDKRSYKIIILAFLGTFLLGSYSSLLSENISGFPLLWVVPLMLYLLSFSVSFGPSYLRKPFIKLMSYKKTIIEVLVILHLIDAFFVFGPYWALVLMSLSMFLIFLMISESLLEQAQQEHVSNFYFYVALGGAIGGVVNNFLPFIWPWGEETIIGLLALSVSFTLLTQINYKKIIRECLVIVFLMGAFVFVQSKNNEGLIDIKRNFFGILRVLQYPSSFPEPGKPSPYESDPQRVFRHGKINHGTQRFLAPKEPTTYYQRFSGVGQAIKDLQEKHNSLSIGAVGLGVGTISAYGRSNDSIEYFEINDLVIDLAQKYFTFIKDSPSTHSFVVGDGRITLEESEKIYDLLIVDAFSGDAIPTHLLTKEAFGLYIKKLTSHGQLAIHISNNYLDLEPVVEAALRSHGLRGHYINKMEDEYASYWVLVSLDNSLEPNYEDKPLKLWTDEKNNVLDIFEMSKFLNSKKEIKAF